MPRRLPADVVAATQGDPAAVRQLLLEAAYRVIASQGLAAASSRAVAREAGVSAGTLYNYFDGHTDLIARAIVHRAAGVAGPAQDLPVRAGSASVEENLAYFVERAAAVLDQLLPMLAATFSHPALLLAVRAEMGRIRMLADPARTVEDYLVAEAGLGRLSPTADHRAAAALIVSMCHDDAFGRYLLSSGGPPRRRPREISLIVHALRS